MDTCVKGELGIRLTWLAGLGFVLGILGQTLLLSLLLRLILVKERNEWLSRQTMCAFLLCLVDSVVGVINGVLGILYAIPLLRSVFSGLFGLVFGLVNLALLVLAILGAVHVAAGRENGVPVLDKLADSAFRAMMPAAPVPPVTPTPPAPPAEP